MKKLLILFIISIVITLILIIGVVFFLSLNGADLETKLGLSPKRNLDQESQLQAAPGRVSSGALDIFTPVPQQVYFENKVLLEGKAKTPFILVFINQNKELIIKTDPEGRFKSEIELQLGANQIFVFAPNTEDGDLSKEVIVGYYPELKNDTNAKYAFLGELMQVSANHLEIAFGKDRMEMIVTNLTKVINNGSISSSDKLDITQRVGIIAIQDPDGKFKAIDVQTGLFPYYFHGFLDQNSASSGVIERKRVGGPKAQVHLSPETHSFTVRNNATLITSQFKDIPLRSKVLINGFIKPKEDKTNYYLNSLIAIP